MSANALFFFYTSLPWCTSNWISGSLSLTTLKDLLMSLSKFVLFWYTETVNSTEFYPRSFQWRTKNRHLSTNSSFLKYTSISTEKFSWMLINKNIKYYHFIIHLYNSWIPSLLQALCSINYLHYSALSNPHARKQSEDTFYPVTISQVHYYWVS